MKTDGNIPAAASVRIETERLVLRVAGRAEMEAAIAAEADPGVRKAYGEMLEGCLGNPGDWAWHAMWSIELRDGTRVGDLCFKGPPRAAGVPEIGYGILDAHRGHGFATEAVRAAVDWALRRPGVDAVEAEAEAGNAASQRVLEKCGFVPAGRMGAEGPRFVLERGRKESP